MDKHEISRIIVTHDDIYLGGAAGYFTAPVLLHQVLLQLYRNKTGVDGSGWKTVLEEFYTKMIKSSSKFNSQSYDRMFFKKRGQDAGTFLVMGAARVGDFDLKSSKGWVATRGVKSTCILKNMDCSSRQIV